MSTRETGDLDDDVLVERFSRFATFVDVDVGEEFVRFTFWDDSVSTDQVGTDPVIAGRLVMTRSRARDLWGRLGMALGSPN